MKPIQLVPAIAILLAACAPAAVVPTPAAFVPPPERHVTESLSCRELADCDLLASNTCGHHWRVLEQSDRELSPGSSVHVETVECSSTDR
jgi:hypothetical protein